MYARKWLGRVLMIGSALAAAAAIPGMAAEIPGELWETTLQMTMSGPQAFTLPAQTSRTCRPKGEAWNEPPGAPKDAACEMTDVQRSTGKMTWKIRCSNPPATGSGSMEFQGDTYRGTMDMKTAQGDMAMKLSGKRVGDCK